MNPTAPNNTQAPNPVVPNTSAAPQTFVVQPTPTIETSPPSKKGKFLKVFVIIFLVLIVSLSMLVGTTYAVAYEKIELPNKDLQTKISQVVVSLPFSPKTPKFLVGAISFAHKNIKSHSFDISLAAESEGFSSMGLNKLDLLAKGEIDYENEQDPKFAVNLQATKDFSMDIQKGDPVIYFKINRLPPIIYSYIGLKEEEVAPFLNTWISLDTTPLETEARKNLDYYAQKEANKDSFFDEVSNTFLYDKILKDIKLSEEKVDNVISYKLHLDTTKEMLDYLQQELEKQQSGEAKLYSQKEKLSNQVKKMSIDFWVDKDKYFLRKMVFSATINTDKGLSPNVISYLGATPADVLGVSTLGSSNDYYIVAAAKFNDFGKAIEIKKPDSSKKWEEVVASFMERFGGAKYGSNPTSYYDSVRKSDLEVIATGLNYCFKTNGKYPQSLEGIREGECNLGRDYPISKDPLTNESYEYSTNAARSGYFLRAKLSNGEIYTLTEKDYKQTKVQDSFNDDSSSTVF